jgi:DUF4097 and DUF4098 domain-containing protein YvlB
MKRDLLRIRAVALLMFFATTICLPAERRFEKKFAVTPGGTFRLETDAGSVSIVGTSSSEVAVVADIRGSEKDVRDFEITANQTDNGVEVKGRGPQSHWFFWNWHELDIHYTINLPHEYAVRVNTSGGDIDVHSIKGSVQGETSGGDILLADIEGEVAMNTSGGGIRAEKVKGDLRTETSGGDIAITSVVGSVDVSTSGGGIRVSDVEGKVRAETSGGDVTVKVVGSNRGVFAETSGGNIDLYLNNDMAATIDASTSGGEVSCDLPLTISGKFDETRIRGSLNGGGNTIHASTSGGNVRIHSSESFRRR